MEQCEQREHQIELEVEPQTPTTVAGEGSNIALSADRPLLIRWETVILKQIIVCVLIIFLLWALGKIPRLGTGLVDRFRYVLQYGASKQTEEKLNAFVRQQWQRVYAEVSSWFTLEIKPVLAPAERGIQLTTPVYYCERREVSPQRIRFHVASGSAVYASAAGVITRITAAEKGGWKLHLDHGGGWFSIYYPCPKVYVKLGQWVNPGQELATTGRELFWEITNDGSPVDPRRFVEEQGLWH
jgi:murein DD-endopeptidase MepM/ murein hydrolase activator NlpD